MKWESLQPGSTARPFQPGEASDDPAAEIAAPSRRKRSLWSTTAPSMMDAFCRLAAGLAAARLHHDPVSFHRSGSSSQEVSAQPHRLDADKKRQRLRASSKAPYSVRSVSTASSTPPARKFLDVGAALVPVCLISRPSRFQRRVGTRDDSPSLCHHQSGSPQAAPRAREPR